MEGGEEEGGQLPGGRPGKGGGSSLTQAGKANTTQNQARVDKTLGVGVERGQLHRLLYFMTVLKYHGVYLTVDYRSLHIQT